MTPARATRRTPLPGMLRAVVLAGCVSSLLIATVAWVTKGERAGSSALAGALAAFAVMLIGLAAMTLIIQGDSGATMAGAFVVYLGQLITLVAVILVLSRQDWLDGRAFAAAAIAETIVLQIAQITGYVRARHDIYPEAGVR